MGIALFTISALFAPLQAFTTRLAPGRSRLTLNLWRRPARTGISSHQPAVVASHAMPASSGSMRSSTQRAGTSSPVRCSRPLRVVRNIDSGIPVGSTGRMVISGRMADVCAELDRLAALEARSQAASR